MNEYRLKHGNHYLLGNNDGYVYSGRRSICYTLKSHVHDCYEFVYITEGSCIYTVEGKEFIISPGDIIFTCPNELHSFSFPEECMFDRQFLHIYPKYIEKYSDAASLLLRFSSEHKNHIPSYLVEQYGLGRYFEDLKQYHDESRPETFMIAYSSAVGLMAKISNILQTTDIETTVQFSNKHINKILRYIDLHYTQPIVLDDIANEVFMSTVYISKLFKRETGMTLKSYVNMCRIVNAKNLILAGERITSVHSKCGFENYSTFYRAFIKYAGMSPEEFKNRA